MATAIEDISCGSRRLSLATAQLCLEELSTPRVHWIIRTPAVQPPHSPLSPLSPLSALTLAPSIPWEMEAVSQHEGVCASL